MLFPKADRESEYKQLPVDCCHAEISVTAMKWPVDNNRYGFLSRTMMFGAIAAVLHYNVFARPLSELVSQLFGIPLLCFCDDSGSIIPEGLGEIALTAFASF